jgi:hypothetical protein
MLRIWQTLSAQLQMFNIYIEIASQSAGTQFRQSPYRVLALSLRWVRQVGFLHSVLFPLFLALLNAEC